MANMTDAEIVERAREIARARIETWRLEKARLNEAAHAKLKLDIAETLADDLAGGITDAQLDDIIEAVTGYKDGLYE